MIPAHAPPGEAAIYKRPFTSLIIVDDTKTVRLQTLYPATTGRNFFEAIRCLESLQVCRHHQVSCRYGPLCARKRAGCALPFLSSHQRRPAARCCCRWARLRTGLRARTPSLTTLWHQSMPKIFLKRGLQKFCLTFVSPLCRTFPTACGERSKPHLDHPQSALTSDSE